MRTPQDILEFITKLQTTLQWQVEQEGMSKLVSTDSKRIVAKAVRRPDGHFTVGNWTYGQERDDNYVFTTLEAAKEYALFAAVKGILEDVLRRHSIQ